MALAGASIATTDNFTVHAPTPQLAAEVAERAEASRRQVAMEWYGTELPVASKRTSIFVRLEPARSFARTLLDKRGEGHCMWIYASELELTGRLLQHEVAHTVMAERFGASMPPWANEGVASRYDNASRHQIRQQKLVEFATLDSWPRLDDLLDAPVRSQWAYATSVSLTEHLIDRGGKPQFLKFVEQARASGWDQALQSCYGIDSVADLESEWKASVRMQLRNSLRIAYVP